ncbi:Uncharacterised protein (plasmid) [Tsukamurella tyrosinosolvens]|uniref:Uncharacterized protein n=1 Tax=Tsukamurella tyrosinosolvens TaxID=57704 RepID=A0A1H4UZW3_TSUTY|nr:hypothetical protein SAMN04489793_3094 [Tsukamurella tyrosinosolvens]VEH90773.1 Uncharacterised protein [Tsukamurella tyrosinosolvens]
MPERTVTVCDACLTATCWQGEFMCQAAIGAGTTDLPLSRLRKLNREHPDRWKVAS